VYDGSLDIVNSTIDELAPGSAVHVGELHGSATIRSTTVRSAFLDFPGILGGALQITDSVLESTVDGDDPVRVALFEGGIATAAYSIFGGPLGEVDEGAGVLESTDPVLGSLADNGGATRTRMPLDGSPAVDGGDPAFAAPPALDQRGAGFARVSGGRVDIGALEVQQAAPELAATGPDAVDRPLGLALGVLLLGALLVAAGMTLARRRGGVSASG
jgi:hypothetical protein